MQVIAGDVEGNLRARLCAYARAIIICIFLIFTFPSLALKTSPASPAELVICL